MVAWTACHAVSAEQTVACSTTFFRTRLQAESFRPSLWLRKLAASMRCNDHQDNNMESSPPTNCQQDETSTSSENGLRSTTK